MSIDTEATALAPLHDHTPPALHPKALAPANLVLTLVLSVFGAVVGIQMLASLVALILHKLLLNFTASITASRFQSNIGKIRACTI